MPTKYERTSLRATFYTEEALKEAVERVRNKELTNYAASKMYGIPTSTLNDRVLSKSGLKSKTLGRSQAIPTEMEARLALCLRTMEKWGWGLSKEEVLDTVAAFVKVNKLQTPFKDGRPGIKWFISFRERHKLSVKKPQAVEILRKRMTDPFVIDEYFTLLKEVLTELNIDDPRRIWNLDETSVALDPSKTKVVGAIGHPSTRTTAGSGKENITVLATVNAAGEKLNPLIIFKGKNVYEEWMLKEKTNFDFEIAYAASKRGWMEADIFFNYMANQVLLGIGTERPQLMVYDGHVTHVDERVIALAAENGLIILKLPAHTSHLLQPLDLAVFKSFKSIWDRKLVVWQRENISMKVRKQAFTQLFAEAWHKISPEVIRNGFKKAGIHPYNPNVVPIDKFDQAAYKRWQKHVSGNPQNSVVSKNICVQSLVQLCLGVINKTSNRSPSSCTVNVRPIIAEVTEPNEATSFEDLLLQKIKQQSNGKTVNKLTRVAKGSEVITRTYLEKQKETNEEILRRSKSAADGEKPGSSGIRNTTKNSKTKNSTSTKRKGVGKKTKTTKQSNNSKIEKNSYDIEQNTEIITSEIQNINKKAKNSVQNQNNSTSTGKGKGVGKTTKTTNQTSNSNTKKDLDDIKQNKVMKKTSNRKKETKQSKTITKANPSKKIKRSPSIASTFVDSDEMSLHSDSDLQDLPSDFFTSHDPIMSTIPKDKKEMLLRKIEIERIVKEIRAEEKEIENTKNNTKSYTVMDKKILKRKENIPIQTNIMTQDRDATKYPNKEEDQSKKKINIISSVPVTRNESAFAKYSIRNLEMIDPSSDFFTSQDLPSDLFTSQELIMSTIPKDKEELFLRKKEIERIVKEIRAEEKEIENTKNNTNNYTEMDKEISKRKENEGKENILIKTNIMTQEKTQDRDDTKYPNKKEYKSKKRINIISSVPVTPEESAFAKYSIRNLKIIDPNSDLHNPNPNKSFAGIQIKGEKQVNTTEHPKQPTLYDVGDTVLTRYLKKNWNYYVGTIKRVDTKEKKYTISFHRAVGKNENVMFVVPKRIDEAMFLKKT